ncbi:MAG: DUF4317 domain-containing protein [Lachnospiraceae bacterium]|nr:DUF4317 domain-containing protein [Lachnospiraceae bacterium]
MTNSDRNELRRRFVKDNTISRLALCYVNSAREKVVVQNELFLNLPEEDMYKYLDIAKKSLSGAIGDNLMEFSYTSAQEDGENYRFIKGLLDSKLKNESLLDLLFDRIIDSYVYDGNFLITVIADSYDVMTKTNDKQKLDESEEVFSYIIVSICPVNQTKAGLGYLPLENRMGAREKDWVAGAPDVAFMFPAFTDRASDIHHICYYTKDSADIHDEIIDSVLGCSSKKTATQCREVLKSAVEKAVGGEKPEKTGEMLIQIHDSLNSILEECESEGENISEKTLDKTVLTAAVKDVVKEEAYVQKIVETCETEFDREPPVAEAFVDKKTLRKTEGERREKELVKEIASLKQKLENSGIPADTARDAYVMEQASGETEDTGSDDTAAVEVQKESVSIILPSGRTDTVKIENRDGVRFVMIPLEPEEEPDIKGV